MNNTLANTVSVYPHDLKVGDVVTDWNYMPVQEIMIDGPTAYDVRVHGPSTYIVTVGVGSESADYTVPVDAMVTIVA